MSKTLEKFEDDHQKALKKLRYLRRALKVIDQEGEVAPYKLAVEDTVEFVDHAIQTHFKEEEDILFPKLFAKLGQNFGPLNTMLDDHKKIIDANSNLGQATADDDVNDVVKYGHELLDLLEPHIDNEDDVLWPMARRELTPAELAAIDREFQK